VSGWRTVLAVMVCGGMVTAPAAHADPVLTAASAASASSASDGSVDVVVDGEHVTQPEIAACHTDGIAEAATDPLVIGDVARYGNGSTTCGRAKNGVASGEATGHRFETPLLQRFGGPDIKVRTYTARCATTADGSDGYVEVGTLSGITVPENIPSDYTITLPGPDPDDPPIAQVVLNETITPTPADGSLTTHAVHIKLFPQGGPASGDIYVGTATCNPFAQ
jgi:hypothetical protein